ncbi:hypothetical protein [Streptomyces sp. NPDC004230]
MTGRPVPPHLLQYAPRAAASPGVGAARAPGRIRDTVSGPAAVTERLNGEVRTTLPVAADAITTALHNVIRPGAALADHRPRPAAHPAHPGIGLTRRGHVRRGRRTGPGAGALACEHTPRLPWRRQEIPPPAAHH